MFKLRMILLAVLIGQATTVAATAPETTPLTQTLSPAVAQADYDLLRKSLEEAHPGLYRYSNKAQMDAMFDSERAKLNQPISKLAFRAVVAETLASIRCGHTSMNGDAEMDAAMKTAPLLPLRVLIEGRQVKVLLNDTANDQ